eukprot:TRINITY_DN13171_c0_g1_i1.p1 TRINITY_DN13171_c0_g1~~TRINITY_DN13171_c0_g1_i1.p1  ORF type:complete len:368 (+),score=122.85 TRINITY_DN13171_c0_g1_i1:50-1153(+)
MGFGTSLATLLGAPVPAGTMASRATCQECHRLTDSSAMLRRELSNYRAALVRELDGFLTLPESDRLALGDLFQQRREGITRALDQTDRLASMFYGRVPKRQLLQVERVSLGSDSSWGYCNMHDLMIQLVRDWGSDNENVRRTHHELVLAAVREHAEERGGKVGRCFVPGDALCRMGWDLSNIGCFDEVVCCDASPLFVDFADMLFNSVTEQFVITPHAGVFSNQNSVAGHMRQVTVPTPWPITPPPCPLRLQVGTFSETSDTHADGSFGVVATCFFIDTMPGSVLAAVEVIARKLAPGGLWVNTGPLLFRNDTKPKLSWEELRCLIQARGFRFMKEEHVLRAEYCERHEHSLHPTIYNPRFFTAIKT